MLHAARFGLRQADTPPASPASRPLGPGTRSRARTQLGVCPQVRDARIPSARALPRRMPRTYVLLKPSCAATTTPRSASSASRRAIVRRRVLLQNSEQNRAGVLDIRVDVPRCSPFQSTRVPPSSRRWLAGIPPLSSGPVMISPRMTDSVKAFEPTTTGARSGTSAWSGDGRRRPQYRAGRSGGPQRRRASHAGSDSTSWSWRCALTKSVTNGSAGASSKFAERTALHDPSVAHEIRWSARYPASATSCVTKSTVLRKSRGRAPQLPLQVVAHDGVECAERFVEQEQRRGRASAHAPG